jgi:hypothetical protein
MPPVYRYKVSFFLFISWLNRNRTGQLVAGLVIAHDNWQALVVHSPKDKYIHEYMIQNTVTDSICMTSVEYFSANYQQFSYLS